MDIATSKFIDPAEKQWQLEQLESKVFRLKVAVTLSLIAIVLVSAVAIILPIFVPYGACCTTPSTDGGDMKQSEASHSAVLDAPSPECCTTVSDRLRALEEMNDSLSARLATLTKSMDNQLQNMRNKVTDDIEPTLRELQKKMMITPPASDSFPDGYKRVDTIDDTVGLSDDSDFWVVDGSGDDGSELFVGSGWDGVECPVLPRPVCPDECFDARIDDRGCSIPICCM